MSVVSADGIVFDEAAIPAPVLEWASSNRVVVLGETHLLREHWDFVAELLGQLHAKGFRQLLVEQPHMADFWLDDYATGSDRYKGWGIPPQWVRYFSGLRDLNAGFAPEERIHVRAIDVNEEYYGGADAFRSMLAGFVDHSTSQGPVEAFLEEAYRTPEEQTAALDALAVALDADRTALTGEWGADGYNTVVAMVVVENDSVEIRAARARGDDDKASRLREEVIKRLVDARLGDYPYRTMINIGGNHAQKSRLKGTKQEWLGDYLVHRSAAVGGPVAIVSLVSAETVLLSRAEGTPVDVVASSPDNELFRIIAEQWPGRTVFLPLNDPLFAERTIAVNYEDTIYVTSLADHYDAVLQYGIAHRMRSG
jgi:hypothetical protein